MNPLRMFRSDTSRGYYYRPTGFYLYVIGVLQFALNIYFWSENVNLKQNLRKSDEGIAWQRDYMGKREAVLIECIQKLPMSLDLQ